MLRTFPILLVIAFLASTIVNAQEAQPPASTQPRGATVLVLPVTPPQGLEWVGRAIQQDMLVDLTQMTRAHVLAPAGPTATNPADAERAGRDANADYVVYAQAQLSGDQLHVSGQVLDTHNNSALTALSATAPSDELFPLEDALAVQVARALPKSLAVNVPNPLPPQTQPSGGNVAAEPYSSAPLSGPLYESVPTPAPEYYSTSPGYEQPYPYVDGYPYYYPGYWGWGWWGPGVVILPHHWHDHDFGHIHGWDNRPFASPHVHPGFHGGFGSGFGRSGFGGAHFSDGGHTR